jgi:hypothetical protein
MHTFHLACHVSVNWLIQICTNKVDGVESLKPRENKMKTRKMKVCFPVLFTRCSYVDGFSFIFDSIINK